MSGKEKLTRGRRCVAPGCERRVQPGTALCRTHRRTRYGEDVERGLRQLLAVTGGDGEAGRRADGQADRRRDGGEKREKAVEAFRRRVARGDYGKLFDEPVQRILEEAGAVRGLIRGPRGCPGGVAVHAGAVAGGGRGRRSALAGG